MLLDYEISTVSSWPIAAVSRSSVYEKSFSNSKLDIGALIVVTAGDNDDVVVVDFVDEPVLLVYAARP